MTIKRVLPALGLLAALACPSYAQGPFTENLSVQLTGTYTVTRTTAGGAFNAISLTGQNQTNVALNFATAPLYNVVCTNGLGWSCTISLPNGRLTSGTGTGAPTLPLTYRGGTGAITPVGSSTAINGGTDTASATSLAAALKTVTAPTTALGSWNYRLGGFQAASIPANQAPGTYTGVLTVTFSNAP